MPNVIRSGVREVVFKVKEYFMKEKQSSAPIIPFERVNERVSAATGISLRTVGRIGNEGRLAEASSSKIFTPGKIRKTRKDKILMDNFDLGVLRTRNTNTGKCWQNDDEDGVLEPISKGQRFIIVHAGGNQGFVENACLVFKSQTKSGDYHDDMNHTNFKKWVLEKLCPNLKEPSLIIIDNAPYHNTSINKAPNTKQ
ncbi:hypothetical protein evm_015506 [Chilo suppressalis]|nr:hypothetical protein evm_015506 [Chilo suppressalis]